MLIKKAQIFPKRVEYPVKNIRGMCYFRIYEKECAFTFET